MHQNNPHNRGYDFEGLIEIMPELGAFTFVNKYGKQSIDFRDPMAVKIFNTALLKKYHKIETWDIPRDYLVPPVPSRVDYLLFLRDLLLTQEGFKDSKCRILDIGVGANCIYPLLGASMFGWKFVGTEIDKKALDHANSLVQINRYDKQIKLRHQTEERSILDGIINAHEYFEAVICNPPFYESYEQANLANVKKWKKLGYKEKSNFNFGGKSNELWTKGGSVAFILQMINESKEYAQQVRWFTVLVSKKSYLTIFEKFLNKQNIKHQNIELHFGQKSLRILCWTFE